MSSEPTPVDPQLAPVLAAFREHLGEPMRSYGADGTRRLLAALRRARPAPGMAAVADLVAVGRDGPVPVRHYRPRHDPAPGVLVYAHGGGWVLGGLDESDGLCRVLAEATGHDVVSIGYRLAPEHRYPAATDDAEDAVRWVAGHLAQDRPLVVMGDSAGGGNLMASVARRLRADVAPGRAVDPADLAGLPPAVVVVADHDTLRDEGLAYADALSRAGVTVEVHRYPATVHGFFPLYGAIDDADDAISRVAAAVRATATT